MAAAECECSGAVQEQWSGERAGDKRDEESTSAKVVGQQQRGSKAGGSERVDDVHGSRERTVRQAKLIRKHCYSLFSFLWETAGPAG
jgi:hypothetical protein